MVHVSLPQGTCFSHKHLWKNLNKLEYGFYFEVLAKELNKNNLFYHGNNNQENSNNYKVF